MMEKRSNLWRRRTRDVRESHNLRAAFGIAQRRIQELAKEREEARCEVAELQSALAEHAKQLEALTEKVERVTNREQELRAMLLDAHDQLMRRTQEIKADLAVELQLAVSEQRSTSENHSALEVSTPAPFAVPNNASNAFSSLQQGAKYPDYNLLVSHIQEVVNALLPQKATVVVVSKGDEELLKLGHERNGWHFPQNEDGVYAGYYPADSLAAISHLEELRSRGADFLLFPATAFWWLERYEDFAQHLDASYRRIWGEGCIIYELQESRPDPPEVR